MTNNRKTKDAIKILLTDLDSAPQITPIHYINILN